MAKGTTKVSGTGAASGADNFQAPIADNQLSTLAALVAASQSDQGFLLMPKDVADVFVSADFAEVWKDENNNDVVDENGNVKARATSQGVEYSAAHPATPNSDFEVGGQVNQAQNRKSTGFVRPTNISIDTDVKMPQSRRRGEGAAYPFADLEVGQSFHIAATEAAPDPAKSVASSVSAANIKYSEEIPGKFRTARVKNKQTGQFEEKQVPARKQLRRFFAQTVDKSDPRGAGVRVWRDQVQDGDEAGDDDDNGED